MSRREDTVSMDNNHLLFFCIQVFIMGLDYGMGGNGVHKNDLELGFKRQRSIDITATYIL